VIALRRIEARPFSDSQIALLQTFADQAVIAIENTRLFNETKEALEQQTATAEILRVISSSPTNVQPVLDAIVTTAVRLCDGVISAAFLVNGDQVEMVAHHNFTETGLAAVRSQWPRPVTTDTITGRAISERQVVHIRDVETDAGIPLSSREVAKSVGWRSVVAVPMLREGQCIGAIDVSRPTSPFTDKQISLLKTFADQAVIAIENVRLFNETKEALERQTATSDILRVISSSPTDVQPVFEAVLASGVRLCGAQFGGVFRFDGELIHLVTSYEWPQEYLEALRRHFPMAPGDGSLVARAIRDRRVVQTPDYVAEARAAAGTLPPWVSLGDTSPRSTIAIPMMREGSPLGGIVLARAEPGLFSDQHVALLQTFADQAVIAIENVRLFTELQEKNRALTQAHAQVSEALDQQTATSEILRVISISPTETQPVFDTIVRSVHRLLGAHSAALLRLIEDQLHLVASSSTTPSGDEALRAFYPRRLSDAPLLNDALRRNQPLLIADTETDPRFTPRQREIARARGYRSILNMPLLHSGIPIGLLNVSRREPGQFAEDETKLLRTFADQAVIAIENVRLFKELEVANRELAAASQHKSEFLANMSHELRTPLNAIIGFSEVLSEKMFGELNEKQAEYSQDIHASGQYLLSLINDILDLSKIEAGRMELELSDFHLPTALDSTLTLVRERAGRRSIVLHLSVDERLGQIQGDERKVRQVVLNLLSNAIKFTPEGGRIEVAAVSKEESVVVSVSDTGVGIAPEDQERVFEEFRQVGTADKRAEGTGLGLTLCRKFVELHGGRIWVKSQVGTGSTFTFTIPVRCGE
jgi:signal transduction histidine kinase